MLGKKETVQKTFRLDSKVNDNLEVLSEILERTQNDLVNVAIQDLLEENDIWLAHNIFVDYAFDFFMNCNNVKFEIDEVSVEINYIENNKENDVQLKVSIKDGNKILDSYEQLYNSLNTSFESDLKKELRELSYHIDQNCEEVKHYLKQVNNYK